MRCSNLTISSGREAGANVRHTDDLDGVWIIDSVRLNESIQVVKEFDAPSAHITIWGWHIDNWQDPVTSVLQELAKLLAAKVKRFGLDCINKMVERFSCVITPELPADNGAPFGISFRPFGISFRCCFSFDYLILVGTRTWYIRLHIKYKVAQVSHFVKLPAPVS